MGAGALSTMNSTVPSGIHQLPVELLIKILRYLPAKAAAVMTMVGPFDYSELKHLGLNGSSAGLSHVLRNHSL